MANMRVVMLSGNKRLSSIFQTGFKDQGAHFKLVSKGDKLLQYLKDKKCDAVIVDIATPKVDVFSVVEEKQKIASVKKIPVFMLAHHADTDDVARARQLGVYSYSIFPHTHPKQVVARVMALKDA